MWSSEPLYMESKQNQDHSKIALPEGHQDLNLKSWPPLTRAWSQCFVSEELGYPRNRWIGMGLVRTQQQSEAESVKSYLEARGLRAQPEGREVGFYWLSWALLLGSSFLVFKQLSSSEKHPILISGPTSKKISHPNKHSFRPY